MLFIYRQSHSQSYIIKLEYKAKTYKLTMGSSFYGRIYPNRSDISDDGKYFLYFALGKSQRKYDDKLNYWTAISVVPRMTALVLLEHNDTWTGGGRFVGNEVQLNVYKPEQEKTKFENYKLVYSSWLRGWDSGKDWFLAEEQKDPKHDFFVPKYWTKASKNLLLFRHLNYSEFLKRKDGNVQGEYDMHSYEVMDKKQKIKYPLDAKDPCLWADFDNYGRLVLARAGTIYFYENIEQISNNQPTEIIDLESFIESSK